MVFGDWYTITYNLYEIVGCKHCVLYLNTDCQITVSKFTAIPTPETMYENAHVVHTFQHCILSI